MRIQLTESDLEQLMRPVRGRGGWQSLIRRLQRKIEGDLIELTTDDQRRILHYLLSYGTGGWQDRIAGLAGLSRSARKGSKGGARRQNSAAAR